MAKEWVLNQVMNRWGLNKKRSVGPVSELIRKCAPKRLEDWKKYYYENVYTEDYLNELGKKLYTKITEVIQFEIQEVTEDDCVNYIKEVVIKRTFQGYQNEIQTVYGLLQNLLGTEIMQAPDKWDRIYNVDFYIQIKKKNIGLQIKPISFEHTFEDYKWKEFQETSHKKFLEKFGGKVFIIFSIKDGNKKKIHNLEVIDEIKEEIDRLSQL